MKNQNKILLLSVLTSLITSCSLSVGNLYPDGAYQSTNFAKNYYSNWDNEINHLYENNQINQTITYELTKRSEEEINSGTNFIAKFTNDNQVAQEVEGTYYQGLTQIDSTKNRDGVSPLIWSRDRDDIEEGFGANKCLFNIDNEFGFGAVSKLYDGRLECHGKFENARVQIDEHGFSSFFPKRLESLHYFGLSLRGGTTCDTSLNIGDAKININVSFYKYDVRNDTYTRYLYKFNNALIKTDFGGQCTFLTYYFSNEQINELIGSSGMSITFDLIDERSQLAALDTDRNTPWLDKNDSLYKDHFALMLYEFLLPDSTWL